MLFTRGLSHRPQLLGRLKDPREDERDDIFTASHACSPQEDPAENGNFCFLAESCPPPAEKPGHNQLDHVFNIIWPINFSHLPSSLYCVPPEALDDD